MSPAGTDVARLDGVRLVEITEISDADRAALRRLVSSGYLYTHPVRGYRGLLGDELRRVAALDARDAQRGRTVVTFGGGGGDLGDGWAKCASGLQIDHQLTDALHLPVVGDDQLHSHVDGKLDQALGQRQFGNQLGLGGFVHHHLHGAIARFKALFRGFVE